MLTNDVGHTGHVIGDREHLSTEAFFDRRNGVKVVAEAETTVLRAQWLSALGLEYRAWYSIVDNRTLR